MRYLILFLFILSACQAKSEPLKSETSKTLPIAKEVREKNPWHLQIEDTYYGKIWSAGILCSINTNFSLNKNDNLSGSYAMADQGKEGTLLEGTLSEFEITGLNELKCQWKDKYGTGSLEIKFSPDFSGFKGRWFTREVNEKHPWTGQK
jgi:hypothetical protein